MLESVASVPGVQAAGVTSSFPFGFSPNALLDSDGIPLGEWGRAPETHYRLVGGNYFDALGTRLIAVVCSTAATGPARRSSRS